MPAGLQRIYGKGHLHFITFSCYRRLPLLKIARARDVVASGARDHSKDWRGAAGNFTLAKEGR